MSYDLRFEKRELWLLGILTAAIAVLLVTAGYLAGRVSTEPSTTAVGTAPGIADSPAVSRREQSAALEADPRTASDDASETPASAADVRSDLAGAESAARTGESNARSAEAALSNPRAAAGSLASRTATSSLDSATTASPEAAYTLQFGAFRDRANAESLAKEIADKGAKPTVSVKKNSLGESFWVVRLGNFATSREAMQAARQQANTLDQQVVIRPTDRL